MYYKNLETSQKCHFLKENVQIIQPKQILIVWCFSSRDQLHLNFKKIHPKPPFLKLGRILRFNPKNCRKGNLFQNIAKLLPIKMHWFRQTIISFLELGQK